MRADIDRPDEHVKPLRIAREELVLRFGVKIRTPAFRWSVAVGFAPYPTRTALFSTSPSVQSSVSGADADSAVVFFGVRLLLTSVAEERFRDSQQWRSSAQ